MNAAKKRSKAKTKGGANMSPPFQCSIRGYKFNGKGLFYNVLCSFKGDFGKIQT